jgi:hypothetical protein
MSAEDNGTMDGRSIMQYLREIMRKLLRSAKRTRNNEDHKETLQHQVDT